MAMALKGADLVSNPNHCVCLIVTLYVCFFYYRYLTSVDLFILPSQFWNWDLGNIPVMPRLVVTIEWTLCQLGFLNTFLQIGLNYNNMDIF